MAISDKDTETYDRTECRGRDQCLHDSELRSMRKVLERHTDQLASGAIEFAKISKDFDARDAVLERMEVVVKRLEEVVGQAMSQINVRSFDVWDKVKESVIFWLVPLVGGAFLWVLWASKQIPGVVHP